MEQFSVAISNIISIRISMGFWKLHFVKTWTRRRCVEQARFTGFDVPVACSICRMCLSIIKMFLPVGQSFT